MKNKFICLFIVSVLFVWSCKSDKLDISMEIEKLAVSSGTDIVSFKLSNLINEDFDSYVIILQKPEGLTTFNRLVYNSHK